MGIYSPVPMLSIHLTNLVPVTMQAGLAHDHAVADGY